MQTYGVSERTAPTRRFVIASLVALGLLLSRGVAHAAGTAPNASGPGVGMATARHLVEKLLRHPARLRLLGLPKSKGQFFFKIEVHLNQPSLQYSMLVAFKAGKVAIVVYNAHGRDYAYFTNNILVNVDAAHPGYLHVFRGVSPVLVVGGRAGGAHKRGSFAFVISPMVGSVSKVAMDLSQSLKSVLARPDIWGNFQPAAGTAIFGSKHGTLAFQISKPELAFPIRSLSCATPAGSLSVSDITTGAQPLEDVFNITLAKLKASGVPLKIQEYKKGEVPLLFPSAAGFKSDIPQIQASETLEQLMPINEDRVRAIDEHWMSQQISDLRNSAPADLNLQLVAAGKPDLKSGLLPIIRIFQMVEFGTHNALDTEAWHTTHREDHPFHAYYDWKFDRPAYRKLLKQTWGSKQIANLTGTLMHIALSKDRGPTQKLIAVDLLADIGPGKADRGWAENSKFISKVFSAYPGGHENTDGLLLGLLRARWGLPVGAGQIAAAKKLLANPKADIPFRVRAMEVLCFAGHLPDDRHLIAGIVKAYLDDPGACIASPTPGRYIYDLSLCKTGRKILLEELADRHSRLYGERLLPLAAFNDARPGRPGYNLAIRAATKIADDPDYGTDIQHQAFWLLCCTPMPEFKKFLAGHLKIGSTHLGLALQEGIAYRHVAGDFMPQLMKLFLSDNELERWHLMVFVIAFGFPRGGNARAVAPMVKMALDDKSASVKWGGVDVIGMSHSFHWKLDVSQFYPALVGIVKNNFKDNLNDAVNSLNCFSVATKGSWQMPKSGMLPGNEWPNLQADGLAWWRKHYVAVRASALKWASDHPHYPRITGK